jgi:hypothetical protein
MFTVDELVVPPRVYSTLTGTSPMAPLADTAVTVAVEEDPLLMLTLLLVELQL